MTVKINTLNATARRCYNNDAVQAALERAIQQRKTRKPAKQDDRETIRELGKLRNAEHLAEVWIANGMGSPEQFLAALGASAQRKARLFGDAPIR
jgi:hypothetical protein